MSFVHLHSHTEASHKDALNRVKDYVQKVKDMGMNAAAITDHGVMYGVIDFYHACEEAGINPILGCEVYVAPKTMQEKDNNDRYDHMVLISENETGYYNIQQICTIGFMDGFYYRPRVDDSVLRKYHDGVIALSACLAGRIPKKILKGDMDGAEECARYYEDLFGKGNFFLELQDHGLPDQKIVNEGILEISKRTGIELVATNDCHYTNKEDAQAHDVLLCMQQKKLYDDPSRMHDETGEWYVKSEAEMRALFPYAPEAIDNTQKIADRCHVEIKFHETKMPAFPVPEGHDAWSYLNKLCEDGFTKRYAGRSDDETKRLHDMLLYQLGVIKDMGYVEYFLIVWDFMNWSREHNVPVGPGRGCFCPGSHVVMADFSMKNIEDINAGELVADAYGDIQSVLTRFEYDVDEDVVEVDLDKKSFFCTPDHKILAVNIYDFMQEDSRTKADWVAAGELNSYMAVAVPKPNSWGSHSRNIDLCDFGPGDMVEDDKYYYARVRGINTQHYNGKVYDLCVTGSHTYCINNVGVHNSAAGSLVTYALGITDLDPDAFDLQFERFLNPERVSMPDIDVDIAANGRDKVIQHVKELYGIDNVCQIITFQTMAAREVIRDTGKVLGYEYSYCDKLSKLVPNEPKMTLKKALGIDPQFCEAYNSDDRAKYLIDMAMHLEGLPKAIGTHAAGVIISGKPTKEYIPLAKSVDEEGVVSQFTMTTVEELGLLKMDFLGLRTLDVIKDCIDAVNKRTGGNLSIDDIKYDDAEVYGHIGTGKTKGVFQLESQGMQQFMSQLKPTCLEDLIAGISLYRPGPMDYIPSYIEGKHNQNAIKYDHEKLIPILKNTYGCIVYQEQVTQIVRDLAGYSMGAADNIRRAMSKKKEYVINEERKTFLYGDESRGIPGCIKNGIPENVGNEIYDHMVSFARYAFNKSHAACYAVVSYQTAWLMHYYPCEYWAAVMTSVITLAPKLSAYIQSAKAAGIKILPPDINVSTEKFTAEDGSIRFALAGVSHLSTDRALEIVKEREENGKYAIFAEALKRLSKIGANKACIECLIKSGAFDGFGNKRSQYLAVYEGVLAGEKREQKKNTEGQISIFDYLTSENAPDAEMFSRNTFPPLPELPQKKLLEYEKEASGVYISGHPLDHSIDFIRKYTNISASEFEKDEESGICNVKEGQKVSIVCLLASHHKSYTKKGDAMSFLELEDLTGKVEAVVFPKVYAGVADILRRDERYYIQGRVSIDDEKGAVIIVDEIVKLDDMPVCCWIRFKTEQEYDGVKDELYHSLAPGHDKVIVYVEQEKKKQVLRENVNTGHQVQEDLKAKFGTDNVVIKP